MKAGVAISPDTPSSAITDQVANAADMLLVMTVYPGMPFRSLRLVRFLNISFSCAGRGGQKFLDRCLPKVADLRARFPEKDIEVDGGVGPSTIDACAHAGNVLRGFTVYPELKLSLGSNVIVAGTAIFNAPDPEQVITLLKATVNTAQAHAAAQRAQQ